MALRPWRLFLPKLAESPMDLDEELYQSMLALDEKRQAQPFQWDQAASWALDQNAGRLTIFFDDDTEISCRTQIIGTFNGDTFLWAWANNSVEEHLRSDSLKVRDFGDNNGWNIFTQKGFDATARDASAMLALAVELTGADGAYIGESAGTVTYLTMHGLPKQAVPSTDSPDYGAISMMDHLNTILADQISKVQLSLTELREVESVCRRGFVQSMSGQHDSAVESYDEAWNMLGDFAADQEPASWIKLAKGNALFLFGAFEPALNSLLEAEHLFECPDIVLLYQRMGQCLLALDRTDEAMDVLVRVYVSGGEEALQALGSAEREPFLQELRVRHNNALAAISRVEVKSKKDKQLELAEAIITCLIDELYQFEMGAHRMEETARKKRKIANETCDDDLQAQDSINSKWAWLMALWFTSHRWPLCNSIQYPPAHDPKAENIKRVWRSDADTIAVETNAYDSFGGLNVWRYELEESNGRLLVNQIYSVWEDEEVPYL